MRFLSRFQRDPANQTYASNRYDAVYLLALGGLITFNGYMA